jgi:hypothetical protein
VELLDKMKKKILLLSKKEERKQIDKKKKQILQVITRYSNSGTLQVS